MATYLASSKPIGGFLEGLGPLGDVVGKGYAASTKSATDMFNRVMSTIIGFLTIVAGIWFIFQFLLGAFAWLTAGGDKSKVQAAQTKITNSIIGLAVVIAAIFLIDLIGTLLGLDILSPADFISKIWL